MQGHNWLCQQNQENLRQQKKWQFEKDARKNGGTIRHQNRRQITVNLLKWQVSSQSYSSAISNFKQVLYYCHR